MTLTQLGVGAVAGVLLSDQTQVADLPPHIDLEQFDTFEIHQVLQPQYGFSALVSAGRIGFDPGMMRPYRLMWGAR